MKILVTGGAGYVGSHMVALLAHAGHEIVVLDNLSAGHRDAVTAGTLVVDDLGNEPALSELFRSRRFDAVMHFASHIQVGESSLAPAKYYANNVGNSLRLLNAMVAAGVKKLVFSSTAAVFGEPQHVPIDEAHPKRPVNCYGRTKWMVEQILEDYDSAYGLKSVSLRYFNAAGAHPDGSLGERHDPETHLIPLVLRVASGRATAIKVYGRDYPTPDGTCIRDYIHVMDLCQAHLLALEWMSAEGKRDAFNLGNGSGFSVQDVIDTARRVTGHPIPASDAARRPGDPARLVADASRARTILGWRPQHPELASIIRDAWRWEQKAARLEPARISRT